MSKMGYPWQTIFLETALRAIIEVHHKHNVWEIRQENPSIDVIEKLNQGDGILYAAEEHVRDAMALQIVETGIWKKTKWQGLERPGEEPQERSYGIDTEVSITMTGEDIRGLDKDDLILQKFFGDLLEEARKRDYKNIAIDIGFKRLEDNDHILPSLIEAKRYQLKKIRLINEDGNDELQAPQFRRINEDIEKLYSIYKYVASGKTITVFDRPFSRFHAYLLVWGKYPIAEDATEFNNKTIEGFFSEKSEHKDGIISEYCKFLDFDNRLSYRTYPLSWNGIYTKAILWVALLELDFS
jgi:hypothetical protein